MVEGVVLLSEAYDECKRAGLPRDVRELLIAPFVGEALGLRCVSSTVVGLILETWAMAQQEVACG